MSEPIDQARCILVLGATGKVGSSLLSALRGVQVRAATRVPGSAVMPAGVEPVEFDLERPATFARALDGVDRVLMLARPGDNEADRVAIPLIDAMKRAGVEHVVNLTAMGTEQRPEFALYRVEKHLEASGLPFTHLRPGFFFQLFTSPPLLASIVATGSIRVPAAEAALSFVDARDVGEVAAAALTSREHRGRAYTLTGSAAWNHHEVAQALSIAARRTLSYVPISEDDARVELADAGLPPAWVERVIGFYRLVRSGHASIVTDDVARVLGRAPRALADFARDHAGLLYAKPAGEEP